MAAREEAGLQTREEYNWRRNNTVAQYIATQSLIDLCGEPERKPMVQVGILWWDQAVINLVGAMEAAAAVVPEKNGG